MNVGPLYSTYLHPRNYSSTDPADYDYFGPNHAQDNEQVCRETWAFDPMLQPTSTSYTGGFPENSVQYSPETPINSIPALAQLTQDIKQSYSVYYQNNPAKANEKIQKVDSWKISDLLKYMDNVRKNWDNKDVHDAFGLTLFKVRAALLQNRISLDVEMSGLESGDLSFTETNLFTTDILPPGANLLDSLGKQLKWDQPAWTPENSALKDKVRDAYKKYYGDKWQAELARKNLEQWTVRDLFTMYYNIKEKQNDPAISAENRRKIKTSFEALVPEIQTALEKLSPGSFTSAWSSPEGASLKDKVRDAYKAYWGKDKYEDVLKRKDFENWTVANLIYFYNNIDSNSKEIQGKIKALDDKAKAAPLSHQDQEEREKLADSLKKISDNFVPLRSQLQLTLLREIGINFSAAAGNNDPKVQFFLGTIYADVAKANQDKPIPGYPASEVLTKENVQWFISTWGMLKRQEQAKRFQSELEIVNTFGTAFPSNTEPSQPGKSYADDPQSFNALTTYFSAISGQLANNLRNLSDPSQTPNADQASALYDLVHSGSATSAASQWYARAQFLPADYQQRMNEQAKQNALTALLGDGTIHSDQKDAYRALRDDLTRLAAEKQVNDQYFQYVMQSVSKAGLTEADLTDKNKVNDKLHLTDKAWQIIDRHFSLKTEIPAKTAALAQAEQAFIATVGDRWNRTVEGEKIAVFWQWTNLAVNYSKGNFPPELQDLARSYMGGKTVTDLATAKQLIGNIKQDGAVDGDMAYANSLAYQTIEKQSATTPVGKDYLAPAYAKGYLAASLPVVYEVRKNPKADGADPKTPDSYTYKEVDFNDRGSVTGQTLLSLLQLASPDGKVADPAKTFSDVFDGKLDSQSWFRLFPDDRKQEKIQDRQTRAQLHLANVWQEPARLEELARNLGLTVNSPDFAFLKDVLTGQARIVVKAKYENGLIAKDAQGKEIAEFFKAQDGQLTALATGQQAVFQKLYESYDAGRNVTEKSKLQAFLTTYPQDFSALAPGLESLAFELATNIARSGGGNNPVIARLNTDPKFKELFFSSLFYALQSYASDTSLVTPQEKLTRIIQSWYQENSKQVLSSYTQQAAMNLSGTVANNPLMTDNLKLVDDVRTALTQVGDQLLKSQFLSSSANQSDLNLIVNNLAYLSERIVAYLKDDFAPLNLGAITPSQGDPTLNKTSFFVVDNIVADVLCRDWVSKAVIDIAPAGARGLVGSVDNWLTKSPDGYQFLYQQPAGVVLLYMYSKVSGNLNVFENNGGVMTVRNEIAAADIQKVGLWRKLSINNDSENGDKLVRAAEVMQRYNITFGNEIFAPNAQPAWDPNSPITAEEKTAVEFAMTYMSRWYDSISRNTQGVSGTMMDEIVRSRMHQDPNTSTWEWFKQSAMELPAPMVLKRMQMFESDRILGLKESLYGDVLPAFRADANGNPTARTTSALDGSELKYTRDYFEGGSGRAFALDAETIARFVNQYGALFDSPAFNAVVMGDSEETLLDASGRSVDDPAAFLRTYAKRLKAGEIAGHKDQDKREIGLAIDPGDDVDTRNAKLFLQKALMLWTPGMSPKPDGNGVLGWVEEAANRNGVAAEQFITAQLFGMDDTSPAYNYPLRLKAFLLKSGYHYDGSFSLQDGKIDANMIHWAGKLFSDFNTKLDPEAKKELLKIFKKSEAELAAMADTLQKYNGGNINGLGYTDANDSSIEAALVFFVRQVVPNFGMVAEGEGEANFVNLPLILATKAHQQQVTDIRFGGLAGTPGPQAHSPFSVATPAPYHGFWSGVWHYGGQTLDQLGKGAQKGLMFGLFMHPTIQLGLQLGAMVKLGRSLAAGDMDGAKKALKDWATMRLNFLAFQYNPFGLAGSALNNFKKGDYADGAVDTLFAAFAAKNVIHTGWKLIKHLIRAFTLPDSVGRNLLNSLRGDTFEGVRLMTEQAVADFSAENPGMRWNARTTQRFLSGVKDMLLEPITTTTAYADMAFGEQHLFWKNMIHLAQNPNEMVKINYNGKELSMRAGDVFEIYRSTISPSVYTRFVQGLTQFLGVPGTNINAAQLIDRLTKPVQVKAGRMMDNLVASNMDALRSGQIKMSELNSLFASMQREAQAIAQGDIKLTASEGTLGKIWGGWKTTVDFMFQTQLSRVQMHRVQNDLGLGEDYLGGQVADADFGAEYNYVQQLLTENKLGTPAFKKWKALYKEFIRTPAGKAALEQVAVKMLGAEPGLFEQTGKVARVKQWQFRRAAAQALFQEYTGQRALAIMEAAEAKAAAHPEIISAEELAAAKERGYLTEDQFKKIFKAEKQT